MNRVCSLGPTPCSQLNWNGTLTRSEIGFDSFFWRSAFSSGAACCPRLAAGSESIIRTTSANAPALLSKALMTRFSGSKAQSAGNLELVRVLSADGNRIDGHTVAEAVTKEGVDFDSLVLRETRARQSRGT